MTELFQITPKLLGPKTAKSRSSGKHKVAAILVLISFSVNTYIVPIFYYI